MHGGAVWSKRWEHSMLCRHKQITHGSHLQTTKHFSDKCIIEVNLISSCCSFRETNVTDGEKPSCALCICIRLLWIMFYIINHHFLWHCLRVIWSNWTTEEPAHRTVHNKSFKNPIQVKKNKTICLHPQYTHKNMHMLNTFIALLGESSDNPGRDVKRRVDMCPRYEGE